jgi:hypothetical protein
MPKYSYDPIKRAFWWYAQPLCRPHCSSHPDQPRGTTPRSRPYTAVRVRGQRASNCSRRITCPLAPGTFNSSLRRGSPG